jgi:hypothetical protein
MEKASLTISCRYSMLCSSMVAINLLSAIDNNDIETEIVILV